MLPLPILWAAGVSRIIIYVLIEYMLIGIALASLPGTGETIERKSEALGEYSPTSPWGAEW